MIMRQAAAGKPPPGNRRRETAAGKRPPGNRRRETLTRKKVPGRGEGSRPGTFGLENGSVWKRFGPRNRFGLAGAGR
jgi:hypothetical protein